MIPTIEDMLTTRECKTCVHREVCKFSNDFEKLSKELREKVKLLEYQNFIPKVDCKFYFKNEPTIKEKIDNRCM